MTLQNKFYSASLPGREVRHKDRCSPLRAFINGTQAALPGETGSGTRILPVRKARAALSRTRRANLPKSNDEGLADGGRVSKGRAKTLVFVTSKD